MKVGELIRILSQYSKDMDVLINRSEIETYTEKHNAGGIDKIGEFSYGDTQPFDVLKTRLLPPKPSEMDEASITIQILKKDNVLFTPNKVGLDKETIDFIDSQPKEFFVKKVIYLDSEEGKPCMVLK